MTKTEIINETVKYYSEDVSRRAKEEGGNCMYIMTTDTGAVKKCAVGRCMNKEGIKRYGNITGITAYNIFSMREGDIILIGKYKGHNADFWYDMQFLHDNNYNWSESGLTGTGLITVKNLLEKYKN